MKCTILHENPGRMRVRVLAGRLSERRADALEESLCGMPGVMRAVYHENTGSLLLEYTCSRKQAAALLAKCRIPSETDAAEAEISASSRALTNEYKGKVYDILAWKLARDLLLPAPIRHIWTVFRSFGYIRKGLDSLRRKKLEVEVLDAVSISVSILRGDFGTASSVMLLLRLGSLLEEWTRKKSAADLARSMALNVDKAWLVKDGSEVLVPVSQLQQGDVIAVHTGTVIPMDGVVRGGEFMVNQASMTGESEAVRKTAGGMVYAGTVVEEGDCLLEVRQTGGTNRYDRIVRMIEDSEKLKSETEDRALRLADGLVPYCLAGSALTYLLTRNTVRAVSILMVDFSCALKLSMPLAVLSAMRECGSFRVTVKGGRFLETLAKADTIVFDKTGTLTRAQPTVTKIVPFGDYTEDEVLRIGACLEEHYPHSIANAVVNCAKERGITHDEMHSEVEYVVAHGIASRINGERAVIGSRHFIFEDEGCTIPEGERERFDAIPPYYSPLFLAISGRLAGVLCIEDPLREEAPEALRGLKAAGFKNIVMMTGDNRKTAAAIAERVGVDRFFAEVLPEDKAGFVASERKAGHTVVMIGDGINDSPALSAADVGIAVRSGAAIAREIADITISSEDLRELVMLKKTAKLLSDRIAQNYRFVMTFNSTLIVLGALGILQPAASALLHNASTLGISLMSMTDLLPDHRLSAACAPQEQEA